MQSPTPAWPADKGERAGLSSITEPASAFQTRTREAVRVTGGVCAPAGRVQEHEESSAERIRTYGPWWLVHTKPRQEKRLASELRTLGIVGYLPLVRQSRRYGKRRSWCEIPLFPGYLFVAGGEDERYTTLRTQRTVRVISVAAQEKLKSDLLQIDRAVTSGNPVELYPSIRSGRRCRVVQGPMRGVEGKVLRRASGYRIHLSVDALGQAAELEIDPSQVEPVD